MTSNPQGPKPRISIIVAMAKNRVIGADNKLPWHLSADLKRFKALTMGHHIIMGRKTFESIGRILPGRRYVIVSRAPDCAVAGAVVVDSVDRAVAACADDAEIFIIGGGEIYAAALPLADRIYATEIGRKFEGDTYFPELDIRQWRATAREEHIDDVQNLTFAFVTYDRA